MADFEKNAHERIKALTKWLDKTIVTLRYPLILLLALLFAYGCYGYLIKIFEVTKPVIRTVSAPDNKKAYNSVEISENVIDNTSYLDAILAQQANTISWFIGISTLVLTFIVFIAGYGIFNARDVTERLAILQSKDNEITEMAKKWNRTIENYEKADDKLKICQNFYDYLTQINDSLKAFMLPELIDFPTIKKRKEIADKVIDVSFLEKVGGAKSHNAELIVLLHNYYSTHYDKVLNKIDTIEIDDFEWHKNYLKAVSLIKSKSNQTGIYELTNAINLRKDRIRPYYFVARQICAINSNRITDENENILSNIVEQVDRYVNIVKENRAYVKGIIISLLYRQINAFDNSFKVITSLKEIYPESVFLVILGMELEILSAHPDDEFADLFNIIEDLLIIGTTIDEGLFTEEEFYKKYALTDEGKKFIDENKIKFI